MKEKNLNINGVLVRLSQINDKDYISITDIAKKYGKPSVLIINWLKTYSTLEYIELWEQLENPNFKVIEFDNFKKQAGRNRFVISPSQLVKKTNIISLKVGRGKYSKGTFAQKDIALHFCYWLEPTFQLYMIREFDRLKREEHLRIGDPYNIKRYLTSGNYSLLVSAVLSQIDERLLTHPQPYKSRLPFAAEADMINEIVFGQIAQEWRKRNADKPTNRNQRDYASVLDLQILANLESLDSMLLQWDCDKAERRKFLQEMYDFQYPILKRSKTIKKLQALSDSLDKNNLK